MRARRHATPGAQRTARNTWRATALVVVASFVATIAPAAANEAEPAGSASGPSAEGATVTGAQIAAPLTPSPEPPALASPPRRSHPGPETSGVKAPAAFDPAKAKLIERRRTADVYENPDGTRTLRAYAGPANWQDKAGQWHRIDTTLAAEGDRGFKNLSGEVTFTFAPTADASSLVRASTEDWSVSFGLEGARRGGAPVVKGETIRYPGVADGVALEYAVGADVLKEVVVLERPLDPGAAATFRFLLTVSRVTPRTEADGSIAFVDAAGTTVAAIPPGVMHDASGDPSAGVEPASEPVSTRLVRDGGRWVIEVSPDRAWLDDPARVYPISVDPQFWAGSGGQSPGDDLFVGSGCGNCNYNGAAQWDGAYTNKVGYSWYNNAWWEWRTYLYYDFSLANNADILRADWYGNFYSTSHANSTFVLRPVSGTGWNNAFGWSNQPGGCCSEVFGSVTGEQVVARDIRTWVHNWTHGVWNNAGIEMDNYGQWQYLRMGAAEQTERRSLVDVTYNTLANTPSSPTPAYEWINTTTPRLCATYSDPNGDQGYLRFDVYNAAGSYKGTLTSAGWTPSGGRPCVDVPAGWLADGYAYYHAFAFDGYNWSTGYADVWVRIDTTPPPPAGLSSSTHPDANAWYPSRSFAASWSAPADASGISGYALAGPTTSATAEAGTAITQTGTAHSSTVSGDGRWYLNVRARDGVGHWSANARLAFNVDATEPASPAVSVSPSPHACNATTWATPNSPTFSFSASDTSGIAGYSYVLDQAAGTVPDTTSEGTATSRAYPTLADGTWTFHVRARNGAGLWGPAAHCAVRIDATAPGDLAVWSSTHPDQNTWYANRSAAVSWSASDTSGIAGYSFVLDQVAGTAPDTTSEGVATTKSYADLPNGVSYLHIAALNGAGSWSTPVHFAIRVDASAPTTPVVSSSTHPDQASWYADNTPAFSWSSSDPTSGITGFSYVLDQSPTTTPNTDSEGTATAWTSPAKADGVWYFHVTARNGAGLWSEPAHFTVRIDAGAPGEPVVSSPTHPSSTAWYADANPTFSWTAPASASPITGYSYELNQSPTADAGTTSEGTGTSAAFTGVSPDGSWYLHVQARNSTGAWGPSGHRQVNIDVTRPEAPAAVVSLTHPAGVGVSNDRASVTWTPGSDATSGVAGYSWEFNQDQGSWEFNQDQGTGANASVDGDASTLSATSDALAPGTWWFHVKTVDQAGNASTDKVYGPIVVDPAGPLGLSPTLPPFAEAASDELGLEQFYPYRSFDLGTATGYVHLRTGNLVVSQDETTIPRQGLNVVVRRVYNATDTRDPDGMGPGWRLSVSDVDAGLEGVPGVVTDLDAGAGLVVANLVDALGAVTGQVVEFTDGDGTTHRFVRPGPPGTRWESPPGVSLRLREVAGGGFELVRPDGVVYRAENVGVLLPQWRVTSVSDRHGNRLTYDYEPLGPLGAMRLVAVRHNRDDAQVLVRFEYEATKLVRIRSLPGVSSADPATGASRLWERRTELGFEAGGLSSVVRNAQADAAGGRQTTGFSYTNGLLSAVTDGRGNSTGFGYQGAGTAAALETVTDRRGKGWSYTYGTPGIDGGRVATATDPTGAKVRYTISGRAALADGRTAGGNVVAIADDGTDAGAVSSTYAWVANRQVSSTDGVGNPTSTEYNDLGLPTRITLPAPNSASRSDLTDPGHPKVAVVTALSYRYPAGFAYSGCAEPAGSGPVTTAGWCEMVADLERSVAADNVADQRRVADFDPDAAGRVQSAARRAAPTGAPSSADRVEGFTWFARGGLCAADGPRADVADVSRFGDAATTAAACGAGPDPAFGGYDATGRPGRVLDAHGKASDVAYTPYGLPARVADRDGRVTTAVYDDRDNLLRVTDPVGSVTSFAYDGNDNKLTETAPRGNATAAAGDFETRLSYNANDWLETTSWPGGEEAAPRPQESIAYFDDGSKATETNAVGGVTDYVYFANRLLKQVAAPATTSGPKAVVDYRYDTAGRVVRTIHPGITATGATRPEELVDYTPAGDMSVRRETSALPGVWRTTRYAYNAHGEQVAEAGPRTVAGEEERTEVVRNAFGEAELTRRRLPGRWLETPAAYDAAGNPVATSTLTGSGQVLTTTYRYDALGRVAAQLSDPVNPGHKVNFTYEAEGAQLTRVDARQTAGPTSGACGDAGVACETLRTTATTYNGDGTVRSTVATDDAGQSLTACHYAGSDPATGYDADKHALVVRTFTGTTACSGGTLVREVTMGYDRRGLLKAMTQGVRGTTGMVTRAQAFTHRGDTTLATATHDGRSVAYGRSPAGWTETLTDWRNKVSSVAYSPAGSPLTTTVGSGAANSTRTYAGDGMASSLVWRAGGAAVRSHTGIGYDVGGLRTAETVAVVHPLTDPGNDPGGPASYAYDLARRLVSYTSPYRAATTDTAGPTVAYGLDDGANIVTATTTVAGRTRLAQSSTYPGGRLATRTEVDSSLLLPETSESAYGYSSLGEETSRTTTTTGNTTATTTAYDAAGHVRDATAGSSDVDYVYDGADHLLSRTVGAASTLYFYWGTGTTLAEETDGEGQSLARYVVDGATPLAQHTYRVVEGAKDPTDTAGTWAWLLDDPAGNAATTVGDKGAVLSQAAFDPYGVPEESGRSQLPGPDTKSSLGFQAALTDAETGRVVLGPRQYDPKTARFTNPDVFVGGAADVALGTDALTGNRYLFAGANPVAYYEDGRCAFGKERTRKVVVDRRNRRDMITVRDSSPAGYHYEFKDWVEEIEGTKKECDNLGIVKEAISMVGTGASGVAAVASGIALACAASVIGFLPCSVPAGGTAAFAAGVSIATTAASFTLSCNPFKGSTGCRQATIQGLVTIAGVGTAKRFGRPTVTFLANVVDAMANSVGHCMSYTRLCRN